MPFAPHIIHNVCIVCGVLYVVYCMWCIICDVLYVVYYMWCIICGVLYVVYCMWCIVCGVLYVVYYMCVLYVCIICGVLYVCIICPCITSTQPYRPLLSVNKDVTSCYVHSVPRQGKTQLVGGAGIRT